MKIVHRVTVEQMRAHWTDIASDLMFTCGIEYPSTEAVAQKYLEAALGRALWLLDEGGNVIGHAVLVIKDGVADAGIAISKANRRQGLGTLLLLAAEHRARSEGAHTITGVNVNKLNAASLGLVQRNGWVVDESDPAQMERGTCNVSKRLAARS